MHCRCGVSATFNFLTVGVHVRIMAPGVYIVRRETAKQSTKLLHHNVDCVSLIKAVSKRC